jgi:ATP-dependent Lon protease
MASFDPELINLIGMSPEDPISQTGAAGSELEYPKSLPTLGVRDWVVFPGLAAPLIIDTPQGSKLVEDVMAGSRLMILSLQVERDGDGLRLDQVHPVGCVARLMKLLRFPDGTVRVLVEGVSRAKLVETVSETPYLEAKFTAIDEVIERSNYFSALVQTTRKQFQELASVSQFINDHVKLAALNTRNPGRLADLIASHLNLGLHESQSLLETGNVGERLKLLQAMLARELEVAKLGTLIQSEAHSSLNRSQRDYYLREQMRVIQRELEEGDPMMEETLGMREALETMDLPDDARRLATRELDRLPQIPQASPEYSVSRNYLDWILNLPWNQVTEDRIDLKEAARILDAHHYGLEKVKDRLIEFLAVLKKKNTLKGPILCLVGPPGVGKSSFGPSIAEALGRKFVRISLGGMRDEAEIRGHRRTYVGAMPGRILQSLRRVESANPVILLDELDKIGSDFRGDPASALLETLDPQQNHSFVDHYIEAAFDLSKVLFVTTANWLDPVHPALRDRLEIIEIPSYTTEEKLQIARKKLVPRQLKEHGLKRSELKFPRNTIKALIENYTQEAGVRQLDREIATVTRKFTRKRVEAEASDSPDDLKKIPTTVTEEEVKVLLGRAKHIPQDAEKELAAGVATGLAWTPVGGELLFIEITRSPGKGRLILTGSLGDVMKESGQIALSFLRRAPDKFAMDLDKIEKEDIHIHVPAGAIPKDGPSAGLTIAVALASLYSGKQVRSDLVMTGEISLRGKVLPVGGIREKLLAAHRAGVRHAMLPEQNRKDWEEAPKEVQTSMEAHFFEDILEAIEFSLTPAISKKKK